MYSTALNDPKVRRLALIAGAICIETPKRRNQYSRSAYVPWALIEQLRLAVADLGYDLEAARKELEARRIAARRARP